MAGGDLLSMLGEDPGLVVELAVGHEGWRYGEITLELGAEDVANVRRRRSGHEREWEGRLEHDRVRALGRGLSDLELERIAAQRDSTEPDDDPVRLTVRREGAVVQETVLRHSHRFDDPRLDAVLDQWQRAVEDVTAGELPYGAERA